jgi:hypothetical protein
MDRGMTSEDNLDYLRKRGALYIIGTPKGQLRQFEREVLEEADGQQVEAGVEVKLAAASNARVMAADNSCCVRAATPRKRVLILLHIFSIEL